CPMRFLLSVLFSLVLPSVFLGAEAEVLVRSDYPGGNILIVGQEGNRVHLRQDYSTSSRWWFYWNFDVTGTAGEKATFIFTEGNVIGARGAAVSLDGGLHWQWLGRDCVTTEDDTTRFTYTFPESGTPVRLAFAPPYQLSDLERFLERHDGTPELTRDVLCTS